MAAQRSPGRPRDASVTARVMAAVQAALAESGIESLSVEAIAERTGVSKATIYRRWATKNALILAAVEDLYAEISLPETGDPMADLGVVIKGALRLVASSRAGRIFPQLAGDVARRTAPGEAYLQTVMKPRLEAIKSMIRRGIEHGFLRSELDVDLAAASIVGTVVMLSLTSDEVEPAQADRLLDQLISGWKDH